MWLMFSDFDTVPTTIDSSLKDVKPLDMSKILPSEAERCEESIILPKPLPRIAQALTSPDLKKYTDLPIDFI